MTEPNGSTPHAENRAYIELRGERYYGRLTFGDLKRFKEEAGVDLLLGGGDGLLGIENITLVLWLALRHDRPQISLEEVGDLFEIRDINRIGALVRQLIAPEEEAGPAPLGEEPTPSLSAG